MRIDEIEALAAAGESETLELKRTTGERRTGVRTVCAMLNQRGGRVLFGVPPSGGALGQDVSDRTIEELVEELGHIDPPAFPSIDRITASGGREVVVITTSLGQHQPYSHRGRAWHRLGNTNRAMSRDEYNRVLLDRLHGQYRWENEPVPDWTIDDLIPGEIVRTLEEAVRRGRADDPGTRDPTALLRGFGLIRGDALLRAAVMLFGRSDRVGAEYPQCLLRLAKFRGTDRTEFLDNRQFHGNAFELLGRAERFVRENLPIAGRIEPNLFERVDDPLYPPSALREALRERHLSPRLLDRRRIGGSGDLRRSPRSDFFRNPSFRVDGRRAVRTPRVLALESTDRGGLLPSRNHRTVGARNDQDDGAGDERGTACP